MAAAFACKLGHPSPLTTPNGWQGDRYQRKANNVLNPNCTVLILHYAQNNYLWFTNFA